MSERRWRSAANRPSRQARRGWVSLYEAPSQKKNHLPRATKIQQPKIFPHSNKTSPTPSPHKTLPTSPQTKPEPTQLFRAKPGQFGSEPGYFGSILGRFRAFPGQNHAVLGLLPSRKPLSSPGDVQKLHLPAHAPNRTLSTLISQIRTKYHYIITNNSKFTPLSL